MDGRWVALAVLTAARVSMAFQFQSLASRRYCDAEKLRRAQHRAIRLFLEREGLT